jgi:DNA-binding response OmpR family regulator
VDDDEALTELYAIYLEAAGFRVKVFNNRVKALAALTADAERPDLLITDYRGESMPVDEFMHQCLTVHPALRILMASGFNETEALCFRAKADRFIRKPFTSEELLREVCATLAD